MENDNVTMIQSNEQIQKLKNTVASAIDYAEQLAVESDAGFETASQALVRIKEVARGADQLRKFFVDPLNKQVKAINDLFRPFTDNLADAEVTIKRKILRYKAEEDEKRLKAQMDAQVAAQAQAEAAGEALDDRDLPVVPEKEMPKAEGTKITFKKIWSFRVTNPLSVPRKYLIVDDTAIRRAVAESVREIPGVEIYQEEVMAAGRQ